MESQNQTGPNVQEKKDIEALREILVGKLQN